MLNEVKKLVQTKLKGIESVEEVYFQVADKDAMYPHIVFSFDGVAVLPDDHVRRDIRLYVDVWDKGRASVMCEDITDAVYNVLHNENLPQEGILPTFYLETINHVEDEDKSIRHNQLRFNVQTYER